MVTFVNLSLGRAVTEEDADAIKKRMQEIIAAKMPIRRYEVPTEEAVKMFQTKGDMAKVKLLKSYGGSIPLIIRSTTMSTTTTARC
jgi:uridine kinase